MQRINKYFLYTNYFTYYNINYEMKHKKKNHSYNQLKIRTSFAISIYIFEE